MNEFKDKVAIVTGGSRGIGKAVALQLAAEGVKVIITYQRNAEQADSVIAECNRNGGIASAFRVDGKDFTAVKEFLSQVYNEFGRVDYLVNNAGITNDKLLYMMSESDWDEVIESNLKGVFNFCRHTIFKFLKNKSGVIVNIASVAGINGLAGQTNYCASKAGIINFTKALAREVASRGIRVNAIAPGYIATDMLAHIKENAREQILQQIPIGRMGEPEEVAQGVLFLLSEKSRYVTGHTLVMDGGLIS